jgi:ADP-ribosyl-[dinitrogen reductase] hydrolase
MELLSRMKGALVGVHVGDSLGAPYETWGPQHIADDIAARGGLTFFDYPNPWAKSDTNGAILPAGRPTDDSEQTACLAKSLIDCNGLDTSHLHNLLRASVYEQQSLLWSGKSTGAGSTTKNALSDDLEKIAKARNNPIGTNGALMRAAPLGLWYVFQLMEVQDPRKPMWVEEAKRATYHMSEVTHAHPHSGKAAWLYVMVLSSLLAGNDAFGAIDDIEWIDAAVLKDELTIRVFSSLRDQHLHPIDPGAFPARGTAEFSLYVALYALKYATSFAHGIEIAVRVGGDTDTYAAIAGGLLGARYGYEGIPKEWRKAILGHDVMAAYATRVHALRSPQS